MEAFRAASSFIAHNGRLQVVRVGGDDYYSSGPVRRGIGRRVERLQKDLETFCPVFHRNTKALAPRVRRTAGENGYDESR